MASGHGADIYQLKVTLREIEPPIWRRFQVPGKVTLSELHEILQTVMGWSNEHLYSFDVDGVEYTDLDELEVGEVAEDASRARLFQVVPTEKGRLTYLYDFGDGWDHAVAVEKILPPEPGMKYPVCLAGKRNCPPEDCGGPWGYMELLEVLANPEHEEHEEMREWVGEGFDPEEFDRDAVNEELPRKTVAPGKSRETRRQKQ